MACAPSPSSTRKRCACSRAAACAASASIPNWPSSTTTSPRARPCSMARSPCSTKKASRRFHLIQPRIANTDPNTIAHLVRSTPGGLLRLRPALPGWLRSAQRRPRRAPRTAGGGGHARPACCASPRRSPAPARTCWKRRARTASKASSPSTPRSTYESRRSREWLKIKIVGEQEFVIGGFTEPQGDRDYFGALVLGVHEDGELRWVGNVGTGFDQKTAGRALRAARAADHAESARSPSGPSPTAA